MSSLDAEENRTVSEPRGGLDVLAAYGRDVARFPLLSSDDQLEMACLFRATLQDYVANIFSYPRLWQLAAARANELRAGSVAQGDEARYPAEQAERLETFVGRELAAFRFGAAKDPLSGYRARVERGATFGKILESFTTPFLNIDDFLVFGNVVQQDLKELRRWQASVAEIIGRSSDDPELVERIDTLRVAARHGAGELAKEVSGYSQRRIGSEEMGELLGLMAIFDGWSVEQNLSFAGFLLAAEVTQKLASQVAAQREDVVNHNLRLARSIAMRKYWGWKRSCPEVRFDILDVIQEANLGLISGINRYEPERGFKLSTYVTWWIQQRLSRFFQSHASIIRVPSHMRERESALATWREASATKMGRGMSAEGLCAVKRLFQGDSAFTGRYQKLGPRYSRTESEMVNTYGTDDDSMDGPSGFVNAGATPAVQLWEIARRETIDEIEKIVRFIEAENARLGAILRLRNGLWDGHQWTLDQIGQKLGVTHQRIRQLQVKAESRFKEIYAATGSHF